MGVLLKDRFEVFKRDSFKCQYCGRVPPEIILELDHIEPRANGGTDHIDNLITACFDCNRGKRDIPLDKIFSSLCENMEILQEKALQIKEYRKLQKKFRKQEN